MHVPCWCAAVLFLPIWHELRKTSRFRPKKSWLEHARLPDTPVDARELPAKVSVITSEDIKKTGAKTIQEAVQWSTGIVMYDQVGNAFQQTIDLRGFNGRPVPSTVVFVDGQRMNEPDFNTVNFDLIPVESIERIEILPGNAAIYGKMLWAVSSISLQSGALRNGR